MRMRFTWKKVAANSLLLDATYLSVATSFTYLKVQNSVAGSLRLNVLEGGNICGEGVTYK